MLYKIPLWIERVKLGGKENEQYSRYTAEEKRIESKEIQKLFQKEINKRGD